MSEDKKVSFLTSPEDTTVKEWCRVKHKFTFLLERLGEWENWKKDFEASLLSGFPQLAEDIFEKASTHVYISHEITPYLNDKDELVGEIVAVLKKEILGVKEKEKDLLGEKE